MDLTPDKVLFAEIVRSILDKTRHTVRLVSESHLTTHLVIHSAHKDATQVVVTLVPPHFCAIRKFNLFEAKTVNSASLQAHVNFELQISIHLIGIIRPVYKEMTCGWMMTRLFKVEFSAILRITLISLS